VVVALVETSSSDSTTFCPAEPMKSGISNSRSVITESDRVTLFTAPRREDTRYELHAVNTNRWTKKSYELAASDPRLYVQAYLHIDRRYMHAKITDG
jgi:hypothetical protein